MPPSPAPCAPVVVALRGAPAARHRRRPPPVAYVAVVSIGHQIRWVRILQMCPPSIPIRWIRISYHPCGPILDTYHYTYTSWPPRNTFFWPAFVTRILTPRSRKSGYGLLLGCRSGFDAGHEKKTFFNAFPPQKTVKTSSGGRARHRNRSGVVELVGREPLIFARVENGETEFSPEKQKTPKFWIRNSSVFSGFFL